MKIKIHKNGFMETLVYIMFLLFPFTLFINTLFLRNTKVFGIGILNLVFDLILLIGLLDSIINGYKYEARIHIYIFLILFTFLHMLKFLASHEAISNFVKWFPQNQYYYLLPLILLILKNKKLDTKKIVNHTIIGSWIICPLSIYSFVTTNYFGTASYENLMAYDIVGTPFVRMFSVFGSPLVAGSYFAIIVLIIYFYYGVKPLWNKILIALNVMCLILTFSKAAFVALVFVFIYKFLFDGKLQYINRFLKIAIIICFVVGGIVYISNQGIYFWNKTEILQNIRLIKWSAGIEVIKEVWFMGSDFTTRIFRIDSWETTLSDNSFLLSAAHFGVVFWTIIVLYEFKRFMKKDKEERRAVIFAILVTVILMLLYDFLQVFPANYLAVALYIILQRKYQDGRTTAAADQDFAVKKI